MKRREYTIKESPSVELLAIKLFEDNGEYACSWAELSEQSRNRFRKIAKGEKPLVVKIEKENEQDFDS